MRPCGLVVRVVIGMTLWGTVAGAATAELQGRPAITDQGSTLWVRGTVTHLQRTDVTVTVRARGRARIVCVDPAGRVSAHGEREVAVVVASVRTMSPAAVVRGTAVFDLIAGPPRIASATAAGCPNPSWTARVEDVAFRTVTVRVTQARRTVLDRTLRL